MAAVPHRDHQFALVIAVDQPKAYAQNISLNKLKRF
jgi:hypothetical protein